MNKKVISILAASMISLATMAHASDNNFYEGDFWTNVNAGDVYSKINLDSTGVSSMKLKNTAVGSLISIDADLQGHLHGGFYVPQNGNVGNVTAIVNTRSVSGASLDVTNTAVGALTSIVIKKK